LVVYIIYINDARSSKYIPTNTLFSNGMISLSSLKLTSGH